MSKDRPQQPWHAISLLSKPKISSLLYWKVQLLGGGREPLKSLWKKNSLYILWQGSEECFNVLHLVIHNQRLLTLDRRNKQTSKQLCSVTWYTQPSHFAISMWVYHRCYDHILHRKYFTQPVVLTEDSFSSQHILVSRPFVLWNKKRKHVEVCVIICWLAMHVSLFCSQCVPTSTTRVLVL